MHWLIDSLVPEWDFRTRYTRTVRAGPDRVWAALNAVTFAEVPVTRLLMAVRAGGRARFSGPVAQTFPVPVLDQRSQRELVLGRVAKFWLPRPVAGPSSAGTAHGFVEFAGPGWAKAVLSFQLSPLSGGRTLLADRRGYAPPMTRPAVPSPGTGCSSGAAARASSGLSCCVPSPAAPSL